MNRFQSISILTIFLLSISCTQEPAVSASTPTGSTHEELVSFFSEWREFQKPNMVEGVPDYSKAAMAQQFENLKDWKNKLNSFDTTGWSVKDQIDWYLILAEMNGLDFDHRVVRPWERDPAFYVWIYTYMTDVPEREGPNIHGAIEMAYFKMPLSDQDAADIADRLNNIDKVYEAARQNLTGDARDLWVTGIRSIKSQGSALAKLAESYKDSFPAIAEAAEKGIQSSKSFVDWLEGQSVSKKGISGVGKDNYSWNLKNVHLIPYTWEEELILMERELARSHSALRMTEQKNRNLPKLSKIDNAEDFDRILNEAVTEYMEFLKESEIVPIKEYMDPAMRAHMGTFSESDGLRGFFAEVDYRDPMGMRAHNYHWFDLARMKEEPNESPIRRVPLLYNIFDGRAEGMATAMEELMMNAGLLKNRPRADELIHILLAQRAARGLGGLYQHGQMMTLQEACDFASKWVPWGLMPADGSTIQGEEQFYLQQPAYGTSYVIGKLEIDKLIAEYARQREGDFVLSEFMDEFNKCGLIPVSLIYWQMTGDKSMLNKALGN